MFRRKKFIIAGVLVVVAFSFLGYMGFKSGTTYYYEVSELIGKGSAAYGKTVRVGGEVAPGIQQEAGKFTYHFSIVDVRTREITLPVVYKGSVPDTFAEGRHVVVEGKYNGTLFEATGLMTKCPSKYAPAGESEQK